MVGKTLAHYEIVEKIGEGGMGEVYRAKDVRLGRSVALKTLRTHLSDDPALRARFEREARTISNLNHPNICTLYDIGRQDGVDFLIMEHLEGDTLANLLEGGAVPLGQAVSHGIEIAAALDGAHQAGVVHRDLKPGNVMLTGKGIKLLDFGLAKVAEDPTATSTESETATAENPITEIGSILGTVQYMSPEQLEGKDADPRSDIFALGAILYEMVTGHRAFSGSNRARLIAAILTSEPGSATELLPTAPPVLDDLIRRCLAKDPDERWQSARDLSRSLAWVQRSADSRPTSPLAEGPPTREQDHGSRGRYRISYFEGSDGTSIAAARGGSGTPLVVIPAMPDTIETSWSRYADAFPDREVITYDRRGTGLSDRNSFPGKADPYLQDAQTVVDAFGLETFDVLGTLLGTIEATSVAAHNSNRVRLLVLRAPVSGLKDWASIPAVRAALASMEHDWEYFTESFGQLVVGWGDPAGRALAARIRQITSREELRALFSAYQELDLSPKYPEIRAQTFVEHHPGHFFPDSYSRRIASLIDDCGMAIFPGEAHEFMTDFSAARTFLSTS